MHRATAAIPHYGEDEVLSGLCSIEERNQRLRHRQALLREETAHLLGVVAPKVSTCFVQSLP